MLSSQLTAPPTDADPSQAQAFAEVCALDTIQQEMERLSGGTRRLAVRLRLDLDPQWLWAVLTDYDSLSRFIPNLQSSRLLWRRANVVGLEQEGAQTFMGMRFKARVQLELTEHIEERRLSFVMAKGDFRRFEGTWQIGAEAGATTLLYELTVQGCVGMPIGLIEQRLREDLAANLRAVQRVADALGGVEVDVPKRMVYSDNSQGLYIDLYPGRQLLKGEALEGFLRYRHDEHGDLGRMDRQKLVLAEIFRKLASPSSLPQLPQLMAIAGDDVKTDLSLLELGQLITAMAGTKLSTNQIPGRLFWHNDLSYWMPDSNTHYPSGSEVSAAENGGV